MPTVGPPSQFFTQSPGLDNSVLVTSIDAANQAILMVVILIVAVVLLGFLYLIYKKVNVNNKNYNREKRVKYQKADGDFQRLQESTPPPSTVQPVDSWRTAPPAQSSKNWETTDQTYEDYL